MSTRRVALVRVYAGGNGRKNDDDAYSIAAAGLHTPDWKLNHAIHTAAITQIRNDCAGRSFFLRKQAEGTSPKEAFRALKRRISDAIYRQLVADTEAERDREGKWGRLLTPA